MTSVILLWKKKRRVVISRKQLKGSTTKHLLHYQLMYLSTQDMFQYHDIEDHYTRIVNIDDTQSRENIRGIMLNKTQSKDNCLLQLT